MTPRQIRRASSGPALLQSLPIRLPSGDSTHLREPPAPATVARRLAGALAARSKRGRVPLLPDPGSWPEHMSEGALRTDGHPYGRLRRAESAGLASAPPFTDRL